jgi:hypothetical protein
MKKLISRLMQGIRAQCGRLHDRHRFELALATAIVVVTVLISFRLLLPLVFMNSDIGFDEGYSAGMALRILGGHGLPYVDAASHRGPLFYWTVSAAAGLGGKYTWHGFRALSFLAFFSSTLLMFFSGVVARKPLAGAFAATFYTFVMCFALHPDDGIGLHAEPLAVPWVVASILFAALAVHRSPKLRRFLIFAAASGACALAAGLMKQTLLAISVPAGIWLLSDVLSRDGWSRRDRILGITAFVGGWLMAALLALAPYAVTGELDTFYYWFWRYNADVFAKVRDFENPGKVLRRWYFDEPWLVIALFIPFVVTFAHALGRAFSEGFTLRGYAKAGYDATVALTMLYALAAGAAGLRFWPHYFIVTLACTGLVVGVGVAQRFDLQGRASRRGAVTAALLSLILVGASVDMRAQRINAERDAGRGWVDSVNADVCRFVQKYTAPDDPIFVWGFDADLYVDCARQPASKFVYMTLILGTVPPLWKDRRPEFVARNAEQELLTELDTIKPKVILDLKERIHGFSMNDVASLKGVLAENYCRYEPINVEDGRKATPYLRKDLGPCPKPKPKPKAKPKRRPKAKPKRLPVPK